MTFSFGKYFGSPRRDLIFGNLLGRLDNFLENMCFSRPHPKCSLAMMWKSFLLILGLLTTPQLHYIVCCLNRPSYGTPSEDGYYQKYSTAYKKLKSLVSAYICVRLFVFFLTDNLEKINESN